MAQDWRQPITAEDYFTKVNKRLDALERREGAASTVVSIVGSTANTMATLINDWNGDVAAQNGYVWSRPGALHAPDGTHTWTGTVVARADNSGMQQVWNADDISEVLYFMRTYVDDGTGQGRTYSEWRNFATPTGFIEVNNLGDTVQDVLNDLADEIDTAAKALAVYQQDTAPTDPDTLGRDLQVGDLWLDTNDDDKPYTWTGTAWVPIADAIFADLQSQINAAVLQAEAAADAAADAMDFAETLNKAYRQTTAPTNPTAGRALVSGDQWFDTDDSNRMYTWNGSAWVDLDWATETYAASQAAAAQSAAISAAAADATTKAGAAQSAAIAAAAADATTKAAAAQAAAIAVANTKNTIFRQNGIPTSLAIGDIWYDTDDSNRIYQAKSVGADAITTGEWEALLIGTTAIADDAITSAKIVAGTIITTDLAATAIDGMTITGATIQTIVTAARGIKINSSGLTAYNGSGTATLVINGSTGAITMLGDLTSGSTVTGAVVTGGTLQTEATAARGIKMSSGGFIAYNTSGVTQFSINATTGAVALAGALTGAGTITGPTFQTSASATTGIKITSSGFTAYNGSGVATLTINATTGAVSMVGSLTSGSTIDGAIITGGTIQTEATAARGIKINSSGLAAYNTSGVAQFTVDAATGNLVLVGSMTGGGTITGPMFQTSSGATTGIKISSGGLVAYDAGGVVALSVDSGTGILTASGGLLTGGSITGAVVTGSTLQTDAAPSLGIKINSSGFVAYDATTNATVVIDAVTGAVDLRGKLTSTALSSLDNLAIAGTNNYVTGSLYATAAITSPTVTPTVSLGWNVLGTQATSPDFVGVAPHGTTSNLLVTIRAVPTNPGTGVSMATINKTTGAFATLSGTSFRSSTHGFTPKGLATIGTSYFALARDSISGSYRIYKATTDGSDSPSVNVDSTGFTGTPTLGIRNVSGTESLVVACMVGTSLKIQVFDTALAPTVNFTVAYSAISSTAVLSGVYLGQADYASTDRMMVGVYGGNVMVSAQNGTRGVEEDWPQPPTAMGLAWGVGKTGDASNYFYTATAVDEVVQFGRTIVTEYIKMAYSWYDANATGSTHESTTGTSAVVVTRLPRQMLTVTTQPAPQSGSGATNAANMSGLYAMTAASAVAAAALAVTSLKLQDQAKVLGNATQQTGYSGVDGSNNTITTWRLLEATKSTGTAPKVSNEFASVATLGEFQSQTYSAGTQGWRLQGDGTISIGTYQQAANGSQVFGKNLADTGWLTPTLQNGWVNYSPGSGGNWRLAGYRKINGVVYLKGLIRAGTATSGTVLFVLPSNYRPDADTHHLVLASVASGAEAGSVNIIASSGEVKIRSGTNGYFSLDNISFPADL